jgi:hypothetical protein
MFRPNWLPSLGVQVVEETAAPLSRSDTLHFKGVKLFLKYHKRKATPVTGREGP